VYGASDPKAGFAGSLGNLLCDARLNHRVQPIAGVQAEESAKLLKDFFAARRQQGKNQKAASASSDTSAGDAAKSPRE
jgi:tRNA(adenine34) deaminase